MIWWNNNKKHSNHNKICNQECNKDTNNQCNNQCNNKCNDQWDINNQCNPCSKGINNHVCNLCNKVCNLCNKDINNLCSNLCSNLCNKDTNNKECNQVYKDNSERKKDINFFSNYISLKYNKHLSIIFRISKFLNFVKNKFKKKINK